MADTAPARTIASSLSPGDLLLVAARPRQGKTLLSLEIAVEAMRSGHRSVFFSLGYTQVNILHRFRDLGLEPGDFADRFTFECSDAICADHIVATLRGAPEGTLAVIDYLQLLDQRRSNPELQAQVRTLRAFARDRRMILVFVSQVDRSFDMSAGTVPGVEDIRLPNPLDLGLFDKACFLHAGKVRFSRLN